jgi:hypothetical protein
VLWLLVIINVLDAVLWLLVIINVLDAVYKCIGCCALIVCLVVILAALTLKISKLCHCESMKYRKSSPNSAENTQVMTSMN